MCNREAPGVAQLARQYHDRLAVVGISGRDDQGPMVDFEKKYDLPFPNGADLDLKVWKKFRVRGQPAWVFITPEGKATLFYRPDDATVRKQFEAFAAANTKQ